ncbi:MAG: hypothetical protein AAB855_02690, partial [Patescibacteria group bacterium]
MASKFFAVFFVVTAIVLAGCDQLTQLGQMVGLAPKREATRRVPKTPAPRESRTPAPASLPLFFPNAPEGAGIEKGSPASLASASPTPTPDPNATPLPTPAPRIQTRLADAGFGVQRLDIVGSEGMEFSQNVAWMGVHSIDGKVFFSVGTWYLRCWCNNIGGIIAGWGRNFRLMSLGDTDVALVPAGGPWDMDEHDMAASAMNSWRTHFLKDAVRILPATPSPDIAQLPDWSGATPSARL